MYDFDVIVIGAGPAGYPAAIRAAQLNQKTAIIERESLGGTCLNWGCIPTKTLLASAERYHQIATADTLGVSAAQVSFDYTAMAARKAEVVTRLNGGIKLLLNSHGVEIISGTARFEGPNRISVKQPDDTTRWLSAANIIVAAGSDSSLPAFLPKHKRVVESRAFLELKQLPRELLILGGGVIGCEFACLAALLGSKVTIVELLDEIVTLLDRDVRRVLRKRMESLGITILTGAPLSDITINGDQVTGTYKEQNLTADMLLVAVGRKPNTAALELERAGVKLDERGMIPVDHQGRTNVASVFAVGDLTSGSIQLAHAATQQGVATAEAAAGQRAKFERLCPACIFTTPEIGTVGLSESEAKARGISVKCATFPFAALGKAMAAGATEGFVKWLADPQTGQLLGAQVVGAHATELIAEAALAIRNELTISEVANTIHCHPTMSEAWMEAAHAFSNTCIHLPKRR